MTAHIDAGMNCGLIHIYVESGLDDIIVMEQTGMTLDTIHINKTNAHILAAKLLELAK